MTFTVLPPEEGASSGNDAEIAALLRERDGYIARGMGERVSEVEAVLERLGVERVERATESPVKQRATRK